MSTPPSRGYTLKFGTDYDYNYDPDGTRTPPTYLDPYDPEYCAPSTPPPASSSRLYSSALDRLDPVKRRSLSPRARSKTPAAPPGPPIPTSPTPEYLETSQEPSNDLESPDQLRKLLVLDLNGTLVYRSPHRARKVAPRRPGRHRFEPTSEDAQEWDPYADPTVQRPVRVAHGRPYLNSFRDYLFHPETKKWLDTMVWSSAQPHSVSDMVDKSFGEKKGELVAVWARDTLGLSDQDYNKKAQTTKDLAKPWAGLPLPKHTPENSSEAPQRHSARTSLLLDDSPLKAHLQPWNHLCIKEYTGEMRSHDLLVHAREGTIKRLTAGAEITSSTSAAPAESTEDAPAGPPSSPPAGDEAHTEATAAPGAEPATEAHDEDPLDPRKEKKKRKRAAKNAARLETITNTSTPALKYDSTLLAVIGVLDEVKHQSNVAGWMRSGSLKLAVEREEEVKASEVGAAGDDKMTNRKPGPVQGESSIESLASVQDYPKKRRVSDAGVNDSVPVGGVKADASRSRSPERKDSVPQAPTPTSDASLANIGDTGQWFEDKEIVDKWVARGVNALEELGIDVQSGIVNHGN